MYVMYLYSCENIELSTQYLVGHVLYRSKIACYFKIDPSFPYLPDMKRAISGRHLYKLRQFHSINLSTRLYKDFV